MNPEYLALVKIGALLEKSSPGTTIKLEKLVGPDSLTDLVEKTFQIHVHNGEAAQHVLDRILGKLAQDEGEDRDMSDPMIRTFS